MNVRPDGLVLLVRATKKLLDRIRTPMLRPGEESTIRLGLDATSSGVLQEPPIVTVKRS